MDKIHYLISLDDASLGSATVLVISLASTLSGTTLPSTSEATLGSSASGSFVVPY